MGAQEHLPALNPRREEKCKLDVGLYTGNSADKQREWEGKQKWGGGNKEVGIKAAQS